MGAKHTPGPWRVNLVPGEYQIRGVSTLEKSGYIGGLVRGSNEQAANAHLICAAPDLLTAAQLALDWLESTGADGSPLPTLRAAIAKAHGVEANAK